VLHESDSDYYPDLCSSSESSSPDSDNADTDPDLDDVYTFRDGDEGDMGSWEDDGDDIMETWESDGDNDMEDWGSDESEVDISGKPNGEAVANELGSNQLAVTPMEQHEIEPAISAAIEQGLINDHINIALQGSPLEHIQGIVAIIGDYAFNRYPSQASQTSRAHADRIASTNTMHLMDTVDIHVFGRDRSRIDGNGTGRWLNDDLVDVGLRMIKEQHRWELANQDLITPRHIPFIVMPALFIPLLLASHHPAPTSPLLATKIHNQNYRCILIPVCHSHHWSLIFVDTHTSRIHVFDSLHKRPNHGVISAIRVWIRRTIGIQLKTQTVDHTDIPKQSGGTECGVYIIIFADFAMSRREFNMVQADTETYRQLMNQWILSRK